MKGGRELIWSTSKLEGSADSEVAQHSESGVGSYLCWLQYTGCQCDVRKDSEMLIIPRGGSSQKITDQEGFSTHCTVLISDLHYWG